MIASIRIDWHHRIQGPGLPGFHVIQNLGRSRHVTYTRFRTDPPKLTAPIPAGDDPRHHIVRNPIRTDSEDDYQPAKVMPGTAVAAIGYRNRNGLRVTRRNHPLIAANGPSPVDVSRCEVDSVREQVTEAVARSGGTPDGVGV